MIKPKNKERKTDFATDLGNIQLISYNDAAGAVKTSDVGHKLNPIKISDISYTTDASTRKYVGKGKIIAVYNNKATVGCITVGDVTVTNDTPGTVQDSVRPQVWLVSFDSVPDGGSFKLNYNSQDSNAINFGDNAAAVAIAVNVIPELVSATVTGSFATGFKISCVGVTVPTLELTANSNTLVTGIVPVTISLSISDVGSNAHLYFVRIPCQPNEWTYINTYDFDHIITDANTSFCFVVADDSYLG